LKELKAERIALAMSRLEAELERSGTAMQRLDEVPIGETWDRGMEPFHVGKGTWNPSFPRPHRDVIADITSRNDVDIERLARGIKEDEERVWLESEERTAIGQLYDVNDKEAEVRSMLQKEYTKRMKQDRSGREVVPQLELDGLDDKTRAKRQKDRRRKKIQDRKEETSESGSQGEKESTKKKRRDRRSENGSSSQIQERIEPRNGIMSQGTEIWAHVDLADHRIMMSEYGVDESDVREFKALPGVGHGKVEGKRHPWEVGLPPGPPAKPRASKVVSLEEVQKAKEDVLSGKGEDNTRYAQKGTKESLQDVQDVQDVQYAQKGTKESLYAQKGTKKSLQEQSTYNNRMELTDKTATQSDLEESVDDDKDLLSNNSRRAHQSQKGESDLLEEQAIFDNTLELAQHTREAGESARQAHDVVSSLLEDIESVHAMPSGPEKQAAFLALSEKKALADGEAELAPHAALAAEQAASDAAVALLQHTKQIESIPEGAEQQKAIAVLSKEQVVAEKKAAEAIKAAETVATEKVATEKISPGSQRSQKLCLITHPRPAVNPRKERPLPPLEGPPLIVPESPSRLVDLSVVKFPVYNPNSGETVRINGYVRPVKVVEEEEEEEVVEEPLPLSPPPPPPEPIEPGEPPVDSVIRMPYNMARALMETAGRDCMHQGNQLDLVKVRKEQKANPKFNKYELFLRWLTPDQCEAYQHGGNRKRGTLNLVELTEACRTFMPMHPNPNANPNWRLAVPSCPCIKNLRTWIKDGRPQRPRDS